MISVNDFVRCYMEKSMDNKLDYILKHIVKKYIPFSEKLAACQAIIENTCTTTIDNKTMFLSNTPGRTMFTRLMLVEKYTDIDIDFSDCINQFDLLEENCITDDIISQIPDEELMRIDTMISNMLNDYMVNNRDLTSFIESKFTIFETVLEELIKAQESTEIQNND